MCNFIIRKEVTSYATVDISEVERRKIVETESDFNVEVTLETLEAGTAVEVKHINLRDKSVVIKPKGADKEAMTIPLDVFIHAFSDKDPNKKEEKKDSKKESK